MLKTIVLFVSFILSISLVSTEVDTPMITTNFIPMTQNRIELTKDYAKIHYGTTNINLTNPKMIVVHYTQVPTLNETMKLFWAESLAKGRREGHKHGVVNVSVHFLVDRDGSIFAIMPTSVMCRHVIGFNHVSIGIENIAMHENDLSDEQLIANAMLIRLLVKQYPSIEYLIGHHESTNKLLPHYRLLLQKDKTYAITANPDPGPWFMRLLRRYLYDRYDIRLKD